MLRPWEHSFSLLPCRDSVSGGGKKRERKEERTCWNCQHRFTGETAAGGDAGTHTAQSHQPSSLPDNTGTRAIVRSQVSEHPGGQGEPDQHQGSQTRLCQLWRHAEQPVLPGMAAAALSFPAGSVQWVKASHLIWGPYIEWAQRQSFV